MTSREQENQLGLNLSLLIALTVIVWLVLVGFTGWRLWNLRIPLPAPQAAIIVPTLNRENIEDLRVSTKSLIEVNLPVIRPEPFD